MPTSEVKIEAPENEVIELVATVEFVGGHKVTFTLSHDADYADFAEQPWLGKSTDIRTAIKDALADLEFWNDGRVRCPNCDELVDAGEMNYAGLPYEMCDSCIHNAKRSGWEPPSDDRADIQRDAIRVLAKYELESDPNGYDGTPDTVVDEMAAVLKKVAEADS